MVDLSKILNLSAHEWMEVASATSLGLISAQRTVELAEDFTPLFKNTGPITSKIKWLPKISSALFLCSAPLIIESQIKAINNIATGKHIDSGEDWQTLMSGALLLGNILLPQFRVAFFAGQLALDGYGIYHAYDSGKSPLDIGLQLFLVVLFNTGRPERAQMKEQVQSITTVTSNIFRKTPKFSYYTPDAFHGALNQQDSAPRGFHMYRRVGEVFSVNELRKIVPHYYGFKQKSKTLNSLIQGARERRINFRMVEGSRMSFDPENREVLIGINKNNIDRPDIFLIELAHELTHALDELSYITTNNIEDQVAMAAYVEAYAIENQLRVAAELHKAGLHAGSSISIGSRTFDSRSFFEDFSPRTWRASREHIRQNILTAHLFEPVQGVATTYGETYRRMLGEAGRSRLFHSPDTFHTLRDLRNALAELAGHLPIFILTPRHPDRLVVVALEGSAALDTAYPIELMVIPHPRGFRILLESNFMTYDEEKFGIAIIEEIAAYLNGTSLFEAEGEITYSIAHAKFASLCQTGSIIINSLTRSYSIVQQNRNYGSPFINMLRDITVESGGSGTSAHAFVSDTHPSKWIPYIALHELMEGDFIKSHGAHPRVQAQAHAYASWVQLRYMKERLARTEFAQLIEYLFQKYPGFFRSSPEFVQQRLRRTDWEAIGDEYLAYLNSLIEDEKLPEVLIP